MCAEARAPARDAPVRIPPQVTVGGPTHGLFAEFERRVALGLAQPVPPSEGRRDSLAVRYFWDQNLFNKVCSAAA